SVRDSASGLDHVGHCLLHSVFLLFFVLRLGPPQSTLFPYTTLFRSTSRLIMRLHRLPILRSPKHTTSRSTCCRWLPVAISTMMKDRKSTRLNSSHVSISYAVFCLKKKKTTKTHTRLE